MKESLTALKKRLASMTDINLASSILNWDQATMLPDAGAEQRGRQMATLTKLSHEILTSKETGDLIKALESWADQESPDNMDAAFVREARRQRNLEAKVPSALKSEMNEHYSRIYTAWTIARPKNAFDSVRPLLEKSVGWNTPWTPSFNMRTRASQSNRP